MSSPIINLSTNPLQLKEESKKLNGIVKSFNDRVATINSLIEALGEDIEEIEENANVLEIREPLRLLPEHAKVVVEYDTTEEFVFTAVDPSIEGEDIIVGFVDPDDVDQDIAITVTWDDLAKVNIIEISHSTDAEGNIDTAAGTLETAINTDEDANDLVVASMGEAGTIDFVGSLQLEGWVSGIVCKEGFMFTDKNDLVIAINDCDGIANEATDFKIATLSDI